MRLHDVVLRNFRFEFELKKATYQNENVDQSMVSPTTNVKQSRVMLCACPHLNAMSLPTKIDEITQPSADATHFTSLFSSIFVMLGSKKVATAMV